MPRPFWSYDLDYYPLFPKVEVELRRVDELKQVSALAYLDSGSDGTAIPHELWRKMELSFHSIKPTKYTQWHNETSNR